MSLTVEAQPSPLDCQGSPVLGLLPPETDMFDQNRDLGASQRCPTPQSCCSFSKDFWQLYEKSAFCHVKFF